MATMTTRQVRQRYHYATILLKQIVKSDFKLRYQGSVLGYIWSLLRPLLMFLVLYVVFTLFLPLGKGVPHYPVYMFLGIILWNYFNEATTGSVGAVVGKGDLLRKINFPKYVVVLSVSFSALINLAFNFVVFGIFMFFNHVAPHWSDLALLPLVIEMFILALGVAFFLSALFVKFRDVQYIWDVIMQAGFYGTPILYPLGHLKFYLIKKILILNPMAQVIQDARYTVITHDQPTIAQLYHTSLVWGVPIGLIMIVTIWGSLYFRKRSKYFAEEV